SDDRILARVAQQLGVSPAFMDQIYAEHAEQLEQRLQQVAAAKQQAEQSALDALVKRCGPLPKNAWREVQEYLTTYAHRSAARIHLNECLTPRLSPKTCWSVVCDFDEKIAVPGALFDATKARKWTFRLHGEHVTKHLEVVDESGTPVHASAP
ncbi:MAG: hypothetical protein RL701_1712, partial [Pseudomonadota bacterium]